MNNHPDKDGLLKDVLGGFAARREALLADTLRQVRRRRRFRQARQGGYVLGFILLAAAVLLLKARRHPPTETHLTPLKPSPYLLVETQPLRPSALIETRSLPSAITISSVPAAGIVTTAANKFKLEVVSDDALLAMAAPNPAVLVRRGDGKAELVFVNLDDEEAE
jgi:hypothetical protein